MINLRRKHRETKQAEKKQEQVGIKRYWNLNIRHYNKNSLCSITFSRPTSRIKLVNWTIELRSPLRT